MTPVRQAFVGVEANLGDRCAAIHGALRALRAVPAVSLVEPSAIFETDPVGYLDQPPFLNAVFALETTLKPEALLTTLLAIEEDFGRTRTIRWGPRTLDLDLLAFEDETRRTEFLHLPHQPQRRWAQRLARERPEKPAMLEPSRLASWHFSALLDRSILIFQKSLEGFY